MITDAIRILDEILTRGPAVFNAVRDFFAGNPGATQEQLVDKLADVKRQQAAAESEWASDLPTAVSTIDKPAGGQ